MYISCLVCLYLLYINACLRDEFIDKVSCLLSVVRIVRTIILLQIVTNYLKAEVSRDTITLPANT